MTNNNSILVIESTDRFNDNLTVCYDECFCDLLNNKFSYMNTFIGKYAKCESIEKFINDIVVKPFNEFLTKYDIADGYHNGVELVSESVLGGVNFMIYHACQSIPLLSINCRFSSYMKGGIA